MRFWKGVMLAVLAAGGYGLMAEDAPAPAGPNVIHNGDFKIVARVKDADFPKNWAVTKGEAEYLPTGGPDGAPALKISGAAQVRQTAACELVEGESYQLSLWAKTVHFPKGGGAVVIHNEGWNKTARFADFPDDTDWKLFSVDFKAVPTTKNRYGIAIHITKPGGELYIAGLKLEPLSAAAAAGAKCLRK